MTDLKDDLRRRLRAFLELPAIDDGPIRPAPPANPVPRSAEALYCEVALARLQDQLDAASSFDAKASTMLSIGSAILPITAALLANNHKVITDHPASGVALVIALLAYLTFVGAFQQAYRLSTWNAPRTWNSGRKLHREEPKRKCIAGSEMRASRPRRTTG